jgi:hypothetical protein
VCVIFTVSLLVTWCCFSCDYKHIINFLNVQVSSHIKKSRSVYWANDQSKNHHKACYHFPFCYLVENNTLRLLGYPLYTSKSSQTTKNMQKSYIAGGKDHVNWHERCANLWYFYLLLRYTDGDWQLEVETAICAKISITFYTLDLLFWITHSRSNMTCSLVQIQRGTIQCM